MLRFTIQFIIISMICVLFFANKYTIAKWIVLSWIPNGVFVALAGVLGGILGYCLGGVIIFIPKYCKLKKELKLNSD